jgi:hypothetical protein
MPKVANCLVKDLERRFLTHGVMDNMGVLYPQYWLQLDAKAIFAKHLCAIKEAYFHLKKVGNFDLWVLRVFSVTAFDIEHSMFKLSIKSNAIDAMAKPIDVNHVFCL